MSTWVSSDGACSVMCKKTVFVLLIAYVFLFFFCTPQNFPFFECKRLLERAQNCNA